MSAKHEDQMAERDREMVLKYQAAYLADKFTISLADARSFVDRFGVDRRSLNEAVQDQLIPDAGRKA